MTKINYTCDVEWMLAIVLYLYKCTKLLQGTQTPCWIVGIYFFIRSFWFTKSITFEKSTISFVPTCVTKPNIYNFFNINLSLEGMNKKKQKKYATCEGKKNFFLIHQNNYLYQTRMNRALSTFHVYGYGSDMHTGHHRRRHTPWP